MAILNNQMVLEASRLGIGELGPSSAEAARSGTTAGCGDPPDAAQTGHSLQGALYLYTSASCQYNPSTYT